MNYTITKIETSQITVTYADGSWAVVPINKTMSKGQIQGMITSFAPKETITDVKDVPFGEGDTGSTTDVLEEAPLYAAADVRNMYYPSDSQQLYALYQAREGNDTNLKSHDALIKKIDETIPLDDKKYTQKEADDAIVIE